MTFNFIKYGKKRINLDQVAFIIEKEFRRMSDSPSGEYKDIYSLDFMSNGKHLISVDFESEKDRKKFLERVDKIIGPESITV